MAGRRRRLPSKQKFSPRNPQRLTESEWLEFLALSEEEEDLNSDSDSEKVYSDNTSSSDSDEEILCDRNTRGATPQASTPTTSKHPPPSIPLSSSPQVLYLGEGRHQD